MDERLERALEFANYRITLSNQKRNIRTRMQILQTVHYNKGSFLADPITIGLVNALISAGKTAGIMVDTKENPINIEDLQDFQNTLIESYTEASNEYKVQIDKVNKARNIKKLMDW
jgi:hypothetical protein|tara:strand:+ start:8175 stop:8522 length:348 start_codon:yes stop_codon:yes gene_type:complete